MHRSDSDPLILYGGLEPQPRPVRKNELSLPHRYPLVGIVGDSPLSESGATTMKRAVCSAGSYAAARRGFFPFRELCTAHKIAAFASSVLPPDANGLM